MKIEENKAVYEQRMDLLAGVLKNPIEVTIKYIAAPCSAFSSDVSGEIKIKQGDSLRVKIKCPNGSCSLGYIDITRDISSFISKGIGEYKGRNVCRAKEHDSPNAKE